MTIGSWQRILPRKQIKLGKIIDTLRKKKIFVNAKKLQKIRERLRFLIHRPFGDGGMTMEVKESNAEIVLEENEIDCPCSEVTMVNAKIVNTGNVRDSFTAELSEGG